MNEEDRKTLIEAGHYHIVTAYDEAVAAERDSRAAVGAALKAARVISAKVRMQAEASAMLTTGWVLVSATDYAGGHEKRLARRVGDFVEVRTLRLNSALRSGVELREATYRLSDGMEKGKRAAYRRLGDIAAVRAALEVT